MEGLDVLEPTARSVSCGDERLEIRPLAVGMLPKLVRAARPIIDGLLELDALPAENSGDMVTLVMDLIERHGEKVFEAVGIAVQRDTAWVEALDLSQFVDVAVGVFEVNRDFFAQRLAPLLAARAKAGSGAGPTPSSSSSSAATA